MVPSFHMRRCTIVPLEVSWAQRTGGDGCGLFSGETVDKLYKLSYVIQLPRGEFL